RSAPFPERRRGSGRTSPLTWVAPWRNRGLGCLVAGFLAAMETRRGRCAEAVVAVVPEPDRTRPESAVDRVNPLSSVERTTSGAALEVSGIEGERAEHRGRAGSGPDRRRWGSGPHSID